MINTVIEGNNIFKMTYTGDRECIGVTTEYFYQMQNDINSAIEKAEEMHKKKEEYFELLVQHGILERPKSQEEINIELLQQLKIQEERNAQQLEVQSNINKELLALIQEMKGADKHEHTNTPKYGENNGNKSKQNGSSSSTSK